MKPSRAGRVDDGRAERASGNFKSIESNKAGYVSNISNSQLNSEAKKAGESASKMGNALIWGNAKRLFFKTGNNLGAKSGCLRRSGMVWGLAGSGFGTNLVQIEFAERSVALGCVGSLFAFGPEFGRSAGNSVLAAA